MSELKLRILECARPGFVYAKFPIVKIENGIEVRSTILTLEGNDISRLLEHSDECIIMAATLGAEPDKLIACTQRLSVADAFVMDRAASDAIEDLCDKIQDDLAREYCLTRRYSCGYGDLPLEIQPKILSVLDAQRKIGIHCDRSNIMSPRKSVTAIWGVLKQAERLSGERTDPAGCESCLIKQKCNGACCRERR